jgi:DEAD/DEAH box helicase domain-containing protein
MGGLVGVRPLAELVGRLSREVADQGQLVAELTLPGREPHYGELTSPLPPLLSQYLAQKGIRLYSHQAEVIERIRRGQQVAIVTPTASGKTLAFNLPVLERVIEDPGATALYLYPLKALTNDQLFKLRMLQREIGLDLQAHVYDGDTPTHLRPHIRAQARILLTNPYALHRYLPWHGKWRKFLERLSFVVIDEAHQYRGVFGTHVALLIGRLRRILARYGCDPQFILSTATIANPEEFGERLVGKPLTVIRDSGAPQGPRTFLFWDTSRDLGHSPTQQAAALLSFLVGEGLQTLCFTPSRRMAEVVAGEAQATLPGKTIVPYRAGYLAEERREIERGLKRREIEGVASTNALELGIDIGGLDAVIIVGYPGTVNSVWQQAGRAGRGTRPALVVVMGFENPLDRYFMSRPRELLTRPHEHAIIDPRNPNILVRHLMCASAEFPLREAELELFRASPEALVPLERAELLERSPVGWIYRGRVPPVEVVDLNRLSDRTVRVECDGELLETMDYERALREAHSGAVLLHRGETYVVRELDLERDRAICVREAVDYYTDPLVREDVNILSQAETAKALEFRLGRGRVRVSERVVGYRVRQRGRAVQYQDLELPPVDFETEGLWIVPLALEAEVEESGGDWAGGLHGAEHALVAIAPLQAMCDRWDLGGVSTPFHPDAGGPVVIVHEAFPGGVGIATKLYATAGLWAQAARDLVLECPCERGCPSCVLSPRCGNQNRPMDKQAAGRILAALADAITGKEG